MEEISSTVMENGMLITCAYAWLQLKFSYAKENSC